MNNTITVSSFQQAGPARADKGTISAACADAGTSVSNYLRSLYQMRMNGYR